MGRRLRLGTRRQNRRNSNEFRMSGPIKSAVCSVHAAADDGAVMDEDAAHGGFVCCEGELGL